MKAAFINRTGPPESIIYGDLPAPQPGPSQCLVKVAAVALNPIDTYIRGGLIPMQLPSPFILGCDLAGTVVEAGPRATHFKAGDRVWGSNQGMFGRQGTFGEFGCFSFHARKSITTGEGGMLTTRRDDLDRLARSLREHGASRSERARHVAEGVLDLAGAQLDRGRVDGVAEDVSGRHTLAPQKAHLFAENRSDLRC